MRGAIVLAVALLVVLVASWFGVSTQRADAVSPVSSPDRALASLRQRYAGKIVYGYGGTAITCSPQWTHFYSARTPLRVRSIERLRGVRTWLGTGTSSYPYGIGLGIHVDNPVRLLLQPIGHPKPSGMNFGVRGIPGPCPALVAADWQVELLLSTSPPPKSINVNSYAVRAGMSRDEVIWKRGYPHELGERAELRAESTWNYGFSLDRSIVRFRHDRVVSTEDKLLM